jgi:ribosomal-protein-alanine N-acetyltransferase
LQRKLWVELAPPPLGVRPVRREDLKTVARIQAASPEASQWQPVSYLENHCLVAEQLGEIAGFLAWRRTAPGEHEILNLAVDPAWRRRGVAARLVESVIEGSVGDWYLEVRESNEAARKLYEKLGFALAGKRPEYYAASRETGIVMRRRSC